MKVYITVKQLATNTALFDSWLYFSGLTDSHFICVFVSCWSIFLSNNKKMSK